MTPVATGSLRPKMRSTSPRPAVLNGEWWQRPTDFAAELPALVATEGDRRGTVTQALLDPSGQ
ncbi:DUF5994 family protein [Actinoplanes regularis]|uniref:DUF5994 family protein n=1 Tax=Actinoplanes regularis TaxID=52697 RepID=UPI003D7F679E